MRLKMERLRRVTSENTAHEVLYESLEKEQLTPEQIKEENLKIAREGSWLNALFQEHNLTAKDKQEVLRLVIRQVRMKELQTA